MPYSKDPMKYPPEFVQLVDWLGREKPQRVELPCAYEAEVGSKRLQLQSFFSAVENYAKELSKIGPRSKAGPEFDSLAELWAQRADIVRKWLVRGDRGDLKVILALREVEGAFGDALKGLLQGKMRVEGQPGHETSAPTSAPEDDADFMLWAEGRTLGPADSARLFTLLRRQANGSMG